MSVGLHPAASENFNRKASELVSLVREYKSPSDDVPKTAPDFYVEQKLTEKDVIGEIELGLADSFGVSVGRLFPHQGRQYGLYDEAFQTFSAFVTQVQQVNDLRDVASQTFVADKTFAWVRAEFSKGSHDPYCQHLLKELNASVSECEICVPIPFTSIQTELVVGKTTFRNVDGKTITEWISSLTRRDQSPGAAADFAEYEKKLRREWQGYAAGYFTCLAEPKRAAELAFYHLGRSLSVLRLYSPANHFPEIVSGAYEYGRRMAESKTYLMWHNRAQSFQHHDELMDLTLRWAIGNELIDIMKNNDLDLFSSLLNLEKPNNFQKELADAIVIYSKNTLKRDLFDKLLYILVALEMILVRDSNEPIQQNLADRIAFAIRKDVPGRMSVVENVKKIYSIRSRFVHHGIASYGELSEIGTFMQHAWEMMRSLVRNSGNFTSRIECIDGLDRLKYS
jgi:hypothetical protein